MSAQLQSHSYPQLRGDGYPASGGAAVSIDNAIGTDLVHSILSRLPASSFASAACVSRSWNSICSHILSVPKLSSAISLNPSLEGAVNDVIEKVLSEPIRPHFVIASIGPSFSLGHVHLLITRRFGSSVPVITSLSDGIIGRDVLTNEFKEIQWEVLEDDEDPNGNGDLLPNQGIILTVGYLPGLKATLIPLSSLDEALMIDEFVMDIRKFAFAVPDMAPSAIILFSDLKTDMRPVLQKLDYAFPWDTVIVGEGGGRCFYRSDWDKNKRGTQDYNPAAVALVFVKNRNKPSGIGEIQFHATLSHGLRPVGPVFKARSVKDNKSERSTWLTARAGAAYENLDGQSILENLYNEIGEGMRHLALYIGVKKKRNCSIWLDKARPMTFLEFHEVFGGDEEYLYVNDGGIRTGDTFCFYVSDSNAALASCNKVSDSFRRLIDNCAEATTSSQQPVGGVANSRKTIVFGGLIFACCGRGESFYGRSNIESNPFLENFPEVTLGGTFCSGEIVVADKRIYGEQSPSPDQDQNAARCGLHFFSTIYLVLSYTPGEELK